MKKAVVFLLSVFLYANGLNWYSDYKQAFNDAKIQNKIVMVDISKHDCPPCEFMKNNVMSGKEVQEILDKDFILVDYYADADKLPEMFRKHYFNFTPAILFYDKNGNFIKGVYGATSYVRFLNVLQTLTKGK
jgi:thioredoxin-related protein